MDRFPMLEWLPKYTLAKFAKDMQATYKKKKVLALLQYYKSTNTGSPSTRSPSSRRTCRQIRRKKSTCFTSTKVQILTPEYTLAEFAMDAQAGLVC
jgi:hypothetical protein